jgi:hypothetical protein
MPPDRFQQSLRKQGREDREHHPPWERLGFMAAWLFNASGCLAFSECRFPSLGTWPQNNP